MTRNSEKPHDAPPREVVDYYGRYPEEKRLESGPFRLEFERTTEILLQLLPPAPARVLDVGGAAGAYSFFLADLGYEVHLVDQSPRLVEKAKRGDAGRPRPIASLSAADARQLPQEHGSADAVLVMGPLYHIPEAAGRLAALREAYRVLAAPGIVIVAAISRFTSTLGAIAQELPIDPRFVAIRDRDLADGQHRNDTGNDDYFTTAYFHRPEDLRSELEPSILGVSAHLLGIGRKAR